MTNGSATQKEGVIGRVHHGTTGFRCGCWARLDPGLAICRSDAFFERVAVCGRCAWVHIAIRHRHQKRQVVSNTSGQQSQMQKQKHVASGRYSCAMELASCDPCRCVHVSGSTRKTPFCQSTVYRCSSLASSPEVCRCSSYRSSVRRQAYLLYERVASMKRRLVWTHESCYSAGCRAMIGYM